MEGVVGQFTFSGSAFVVMIAVLTGVLGGLLYVALRRWVPGSGWRRGLAFGCLLFFLAGPTILRAENLDFNRWGPPSLNVCMFSSLFVLFGVLVAPLADRLDRSLPAPALRIPTLAVYALVLVLLGPVTLLTGAGLDTGPAMGRYGYLVMLGILLVALILSLARGGRAGANPTIRRLGYAALGILCLSGLVLNLRAVAGILSASGR